MKCPECNDADQQERLGPTNEAAGQTAYHCSHCGRLYAVPSDIADLSYRLVEMKARFDTLGSEMGALAREIAAAEAELLGLYERRAGGG